MLQQSASDNFWTDSPSSKVRSAYASSASLAPQTPQQASASLTKSVAPIPRWELVFPDEPISIKIVSQRYRPPNETTWKQRIGWISVTNTAGQVVYDPFITYPKEPGLKKYFSNKRYDVGKEDLLFRNGARDGQEVEKNLMKLFDERIVVVHGGQGYSDSCYFYQNALGDSLVWDTQALYADTQKDGQPALCTVARLVLGRSIRQDSDDTRRPDQDAVAAMELYLLRFPYDREAKRKQYELGGWTPKAQLRSPQKKQKEIRKVQSSMVLSGPPKRDLTSACGFVRRTTSAEEPRAPRATPEKKLDAAAQFTLRIQRRHFADLGTHGRQPSESKVC